VAPARGRRLHPDVRAPAGVLQPAALLRPGPARGLRQVGTPPVRVATWNIRAAIGPGEPFPPAWWRHTSSERLERIGRIISELDADAIALQEVAFFDVDGAVVDQPLELSRLTGREVRYGAVHAFALVEPETGRAIGSATWGNALLTRAPVRDGFTHGLPVGGDDDLVEPVDTDLPLAGVRFADAPHGTREPRCSVGGTAELAGGDVAVVSTHLAYAGTGQRVAQAAALAAEGRNLGGPMVILGDFNAPIDAPELEPLGSAFVDAFAAVGVPPGDPARQSCGPWPIDHIFVRGLTVEDCQAVRAAGDASDHLPIAATLRSEVG
jgi:endonuclease/exonuclease/phosphatase family metal-dependent hydrolase